MLLQTNSYVVPKEKRAEHARLMQQFHRCFRRLGSTFDVFEQTGHGFTGEGGGRFVQMMRFRDRRHQQDVHQREKADATAQQLIAAFCKLVNLPYQQQQGLFAAGFYVALAADPDTSDAEPGVEPGAVIVRADDDAAAPPPPGEPRDARSPQTAGTSAPPGTAP